MASGKNETLGFYTVEHDEMVGWMGGFLLLNAVGRPLEFHCTLPLRPTKTQQVLYGPSLKPFLIGELMGRSLLERTKLRPQLIVVDLQDALPLADTAKLPVACVAVPKKANVNDVIELGDRELLSASGCREKVMQILSDLPAGLDLREPFDRIREAFCEARGNARSNAA